MNRLNLLNDFLFKKLFGDENDNELLIGLLNAILKKEIVNLTIESEKLDRFKEEEKLGILNIKAKMADGEKVNIEVQLLNQKNMIPRTLFYWSKLFVEDFESGRNYKELKKTVTINILGFKLEELRSESFHSIYKLGEAQTNNNLTDLLEIHFIEFPKFEDVMYDLNNPLHCWLLFLKDDVPDYILREVLRMDVISKAEEKLTMLSADPETRREYERRAKALSDERSRLEDARESGIEKGILSVVKGLLPKGMPLNEAAKLTPYTVEELSRMLEEIEE
ncbi:Rpn family recombination-promoting nuclease/putative transposase [Bacillus sp. EB106-08-02-XG196]|uniref:Rpn family recombination-promoting nuclease/putative transposase n=1 Tax=Bacillus sp. EB106-08-02-XG196 TaxID=2737049 RepID=UPI0015C4E1D6|nr:Rpn family recombination-promoting nuclease/putative transposase [Bacillus sp. EB106-08-02-XG196]NWQ41043.1 Rpn family recombination-promoting nuclease/putative transposase [Bacillus sp. EB106-08-02-XG196]